VAAFHTEVDEPEGDAGEHPPNGGEDEEEEKGACEKRKYTTFDREHIQRRFSALTCIRKY
jgi:hypothetical protein